MRTQGFSDVYESQVTPDNQLQPLKEAAYDSAFRFDVVQHHEQGIGMIDEFLPKLKRADLRAMMEKMKAAQTAEIAKSAESSQGERRDGTDHEVRRDARECCPAPCAAARGRQLHASVRRGGSQFAQPREFGSAQPLREGADLRSPQVMMEPIDEFYARPEADGERVDRCRPTVA